MTAIHAVEGLLEASPAGLYAKSAERNVDRTVRRWTPQGWSSPTQETGMTLLVKMTAAERMTVFAALLALVPSYKLPMVVRLTEAFLDHEARIDEAA